MLVNMRSLLAIAGRRECAIPAFNVYNGETAMGVLRAAEEANACVIVQMYSRLFMSEEAEFLSPAILAAAHRSPVKICFHLDHGGSDEAVFRAVRYGCTSVMRDASALPLEENIAALKNITHLAHDLGIDVEGELGHIGSARDKVPAEFTNVEEAGGMFQNSVHFLSLSILTASLFIGSSLLCLAPVKPLLLGIPWPAFVGFCIAGVLFICLLLRIFFRRK